MAEYVKIPRGLDRPMLERQFGYAAVSFYFDRLAQRERESEDEEDEE